jgi:uncharacterized membrane protein SpoIIM required for sporulation
MISTSWLKKRRETWLRLQHLLDKAGSSGLKSLDRAELRELCLLYRQSAADLSTLRQDESGATYEKFVHQLLRRAHNVVYASETPPRGAILHFVTRGFPEAFMRNAGLIGMTFVLFLGAAVLGTILTLYDPDFALQIIGPRMMQSIEKREMWTHSILSIKPAASSMIMTNNISVSIATFAGGILGGLGTAWLIFFNGLLIGVIGTTCWAHGMSLQLWSFVAAHGVLELPAIFIAGGAGLRLAQGLLFPGYLPRRDSVVLAGRDAVSLLLGTIPILVIAGLIEGFVSPSPMRVSLKFTLAAALFILLLAYLFSPVLRRRRATVAPADATQTIGSEPALAKT